MKGKGGICRASKSERGGREDRGGGFFGASFCHHLNFVTFLFLENKINK